MTIQTLIADRLDANGSLDANFTGTAQDISQFKTISLVSKVETKGIATVQALADTAGNRGGKYFTLNSPTTAYYVWLTHSGRAEITDIQCPADTDGSLGGKRFNLNSPATAYYVWLTHTGRAEVTDIQCPADSSGSLGGTYFTLNSPTTAYYVWFDVDNGSSDPAPAGKTGIEVDIAADDSAATVATAVKNAIDAEADFGATVLTDTVTVTNAAVGAVTDAADVDAGVTPTVTTQGISVPADPAPAGKTGIQVNYSIGDNADTVAAAVQAAIDAEADFSATVLTDTVTVTNAAVGSVTDAADVDAGVTPTVTTQGISVPADPAPAGKTAIQVSYAIGDTANTIASAINTAVDATNDFSSSVATDTATITNANYGTVTDAADVDTGFTVTPSYSAISGTLKLQVSNNNSDWVDSAVTSSVSAKGNFLLNIADCASRFLRLAYTRSSGGGKVTATLFAKG